MAPARRLDQTYRHMMRRHPFGYALFKPAMKKLMRPGSCGYFDHSGQWNRLFNLDDSKAFDQQNTMQADCISEETVETGIRWEPMLSEGTMQQDMGLSMGAPGILSGLPIDIDCQYKLATSATFGAVLVTTPPIHHHRLAREFEVRHWFDRNVHSLLASHFRRPIQQHGLFIVTGTYSTTQCSITTWNDSSGEAFIGFNAGVAGTPVAGPYGGWRLGHTSTHWSHYDAPSDDRYVVFVTGYLFKPRVLFSQVFTKVKTDSKMRGMEMDIGDGSEPNSTGPHNIEFSCEVFDEIGDDPEVTHPKKPGKWAVLIGINRYDVLTANGRGIPPLFGCVEDVNAMENYFCSVGVHKSNIFKLTADSRPHKNEQNLAPTHNNIINAIRKVCEKAAESDIVYIHFSGHGGKYRGEEILLPMDIMTKRRPLTGSEMRGLIKEMLEKKLFVTFALDCCHSSGVLDGRNSDHEVNVTDIRGIGDLDDLLVANSKMQRDTAEPNDCFISSSGLRDTRGMTSDDRTSPVSGKYTVIAACRPDENAYEVRIQDGLTFGAFTYALIKALKNPNAQTFGSFQLSYWRLYWHLSSNVNGLLKNMYKQNVFTSGMTTRTFFDNTELDLLTTPTINSFERPADINTCVWLNTSECLGGKVGAKFKVYPLSDITFRGNGQESHCLACCQVKSIEDGLAKACWTKLFSDAKELVEGCPVVPDDLEGQKLVKLTKTGTSEQDEARNKILEDLHVAWKSVMETHARFVDNTWQGPTHYQVIVDDELRYQLQDQTGYTIWTSGGDLDEGNDMASVTLVRHLMRSAKFEKVRELQLQSTPEKSLVNFQVLGRMPLNYGERHGAPTRSRCTDAVPDYISNRGDAPKGPIDYHGDSYIVLSVDNIFSSSIYITLICLDPSNRSVAQIYPTRKASGPSSTEKLGPGDRRLIPIRWKRDEEQNTQKAGKHTETVKLLASVRDMDFSLLLIDDADEHRQSNGRDESVGGSERFQALYKKLVNLGATLPPEDRMFEVVKEVSIYEDIKNIEINVVPNTGG